jgi:hypothetical protein
MDTSKNGCQGVDQFVGEFERETGISSQEVEIRRGVKEIKAFETVQQSADIEMLSIDEKMDQNGSNAGASSGGNNVSTSKQKGSFFRLNEKIKIVKN